MNAILDSNMFYYLSGIGKQNYSAKLISKQLEKFDSIYVSELTLLELLSRCRDNRNKFLKASNYLVDAKIKIHQILEDENTIVKKANDERIMDLTFYRSLCTEATNLRAKIEGEFLTYWLGSISSLFLMFLFRVDPGLSDESKIKILRQYNSMVDSISVATGYVQMKIAEILDRYYYITKKEIDQEFNKLLIELLETYNYVFEAGKANQVFFEVVRARAKNGKESDEFFEGSEIGKILRKKIISGKAKIIRNLHLDLYDEVERSFEEKVKSFDWRLLKYNLIVFRKYLTNENYLIRKNDIFDSLFLKYCGSHILLTFDREFRKRIRVIDPPSSAEIESLITACGLG